MTGKILQVRTLDHEAQTSPSHKFLETICIIVS